MKISKKALLAAAAFAGILNMNGCVYGPPAQEFDEGAEYVMGRESDYDPAANTVAPVYGPPPVEELSQPAQDESLPAEDAEKELP